MKSPRKKRRFKRVKIQEEVGSTQTMAEEDEDVIVAMRPMERSEIIPEELPIGQNELTSVAEEETMVDEKTEALMVGELQEEQEFLEAERIKRARWENMTLTAILAELGWVYADINKIFQGNQSTTSNLFIKKCIIEGWKPVLGRPEINAYYHQGILVVEAWTFTLAINGALNEGMRWDRGEVFRWVKPHAPIEPQLTNKYNLYELRTTPTQLELEYKAAKAFDPPFTGNIYEFKRLHNGSSAVYKSNFIKQKTAALPDKILIPYKITGLVGDASMEKPDSGATLRGKPYTEKDAENISPGLGAIASMAVIRHLPFNTRVHIQSETADGWYYVKTEFGETGYVAKHLVSTNLPAPDARLYLVKEGDTALQIARRFYSSYTKDGKENKESVGQVEAKGDFRNYVMKLAQVNAGRGMAFPTTEVDNENAWANVKVFKGLRIWIPSAAHMYELIEATPSENLHGSRWIKDSLQFVLNQAPGVDMIKAFIAELRRIPLEQRKAGIDRFHSIILSLLKKLRFETPGWADALLLAIPTGKYAYLAKSLFTFFREFQIGYIEHLMSLDPEILVTNFERFFLNLTRVDYYAGLVEGIGTGIVGWFMDLYEMGDMLVKMFLGLIDLEGHIQKLEKLGPLANQIIQFLSANGQEFLSLLLSINPLIILEGAEKLIGEAGQKVGGMLADAIVGFMSKGPYDMGKSIGTIIGFLIPEVVLAVFSGAIGNAVKATLKVFQQVMLRVIRPLIQGFKVAMNTIHEGIAALKLVVRYVDDMIAMMVKSGKDSTFFKKLKELLMKFEDFMKGKADEVVEEAGGKVDDIKKVPDETPKGLDENDPNRTEKIQAYVKAKALTETADAIEPTLHPSILVKVLDKSINYNKVKFVYDNQPKFELKGNLIFIGSFEYTYEMPDYMKEILGE